MDNDERECRLLSRPAAAKYLGVSPGTLAVWATNQRYDLPYSKIGGKVMYDLEDLNRFIRDRKVYY
jgi:hypothetical protein